MSPVRSKIVYFVSEDYYFVSHREALARTIALKGWEVVVCTRISQWREHLNELGFRVYDISINRGGLNVFKDLLVFLRLVGVLLKEKPDLLHNIALKPILLGTLAAWVANVPVINTFAGLGFLSRKCGGLITIVQRLIALLFRVVLRWRKSHVIVQNSTDWHTMTEQWGGCRERISLIRGSGVDLLKFSPSLPPSAPIRVVMISRLIKTKGVAEFAKASGILRARGASIESWLVGRIDEGSRDAVQPSELEEWQKSCQIRVLGFNTEIWSLLQKVHIVVLPSYYGEGVPKTLIEAAASARPIVTTDTPGCNDIVRHGVNGLLVPPRDEMALADAIEKLAANGRVREVMGQNGRSLVEREFGNSTVISQTIEVYRRASGKEIAQVRTGHVS